MKESLYNRQISLMLYTGLAGFGVVNIPRIAGEAGSSGGWVFILINSIIFALFAYIIVYIAYNNENETLFEYCNKYLGKILTYIIISIYIIYFFALLSMIVRIFAENIRLTILFKTPAWAICLLIFLVIAYALTKGLRAIGRVSQIYGLLSITGLLVITFLVFTKGQIVNLKPFFIGKNFPQYLKSILDTTFPFLGIELIFFIPLNKETNAGIIKSVPLTVFFIGIFYILIAEAFISVVGAEDIINYNAPILKVLIGIDLPYLEFFRRLDGLFLLYWTMNIFCATCIWAYGTVYFLSKILKKINKNLIMIIVIFLAFIIALIPHNTGLIKKILDYTGYIGIFTSLVIPLILFIVMKVKNNEKKIT